MFSIDLDALDKDGLLEAVYVSPSVIDVPTLKEQWESDELLIKLYDFKSKNFSKKNLPKFKNIVKRC